jgi:hypothetical protein
MANPISKKNYVLMSEQIRAYKETITTRDTLQWNRFYEQMRLTPEGRKEHREV